MDEVNLLKMTKDIIIVNFKTYEKSTGDFAKSLAITCHDVSNTTGIKVIAAVQAIDIRLCAQTHATIFAQHIDAIDFGAHTGFTLADSVKSAGATGTILNHSEHRLHIDELKKSIDAAKKRDLLVVACADSPEWAEKVAHLNPDYIAIEPPELIGGDISVSTARPEIISQTIERVHKIKKIPILCGAGIKNGNDVRIAKKLGAEGILVASGVVGAKDQKAALLDLAQGFND